MMNKKEKIIKSKKLMEAGQASKMIIILVLVLVVVVVIIFGVIKFVGDKKNQTPKSDDQSNTDNPSETQKPVYETTIGDVRFVLESSQDLGSVLVTPISYDKDVVTTERFIKVVIGAQNKGKINLTQNTWTVGNIIDSEGRNFIAINDKAYSLLPKPDLCGSILKPEFEPIPCVKYYEVSKISKNLKIVVNVTTPKKKEALIDLNLSHLLAPKVSPTPSPKATPSLVCNNDGFCDSGETCITCSSLPGGGCSGCADCSFCTVQP